MKANELMVGDWVMLFQGGKDNTNCNVRVTEIGKHEIGVSGEDCEYDAAVATLLFPIPLTEEILVKNGIKISSFTGTLYWFDEEEHCCVKPIEDTYLFMFSKGADYVTLRINNIHQLQHLLTLCGIEKTIEL